MYLGEKCGLGPLAGEKQGKHCRSIRQYKVSSIGRFGEVHEHIIDDVNDLIKGSERLMLQVKHPLEPESQMTLSLSTRAFMSVDLISCSDKPSSIHRKEKSGLR